MLSFDMISFELSNVFNDKVHTYQSVYKKQKY